MALARGAALWFVTAMLCATPALAHEFLAFKFNHTASEAEPFKTVSKSPEETKQVFVFGNGLERECL